MIHTRIYVITHACGMFLVGFSITGACYKHTNIKTSKRKYTDTFSGKHVTHVQ